MLNSGLEEKYLEKIMAVMGREVIMKEVPFGLVFDKKRRFALPGSTKRWNFYGLWMDLDDRVLHERVAVIKTNTGIRSHEEESQEVVKNIGNSPITYVKPESRRVINPGETIYSMHDGEGFFHGFEVEEMGMLYVAKALMPEYVVGDSFRVPENTYRG